MRGDISEKARSLARYVDRLPNDSTHVIEVEKTRTGDTWKITVIERREEERRQWELKK